MLVTWLVEIEMTKINEFKASNPSNLTKPMDQVDEAAMIQFEQQKIVVDIMESDFHKFLVDNSDDLDQDTILQLLQSHGKINDCIKYADTMKQY